MGIGEVTGNLSEFHDSFVEGVDPLEQIDFILGYIKANSDSKRKNMVTHVDLERHVIANRTIIGIKRIRFYQILEKLKDDGFILIRGEHKYYDLTFKGVVFEGYSMAKKSSDAEKSLMKNLAIQTERNSRKLNQLTMILALGSVALLFVTGIEKMHFGSIYFWTGVMLGLCCILFTLIVWLLMLEAQTRRQE